MLKKFDRLRKKYNDQSLSNYELIEIMLEKELKAPNLETKSQNNRAAKKMIVRTQLQFHRQAKVSEHADKSQCASIPVQSPTKLNASSTPVQLLAKVSTRSTPVLSLAKVSASIVSSRYIPRKVKKAVYNGKCANCGVKYGLEYDHIKEIFSWGK